MKTISTLKSKAILALIIFSLINSQVSAGTNYPCNYIAINAHVNNKSLVLLKWVADANANTGYAEIEQSFDNINFKTVGIVLDGFDLANAQKSYQFKDISAGLLINSKVYYRLKQIDNNGNKITYSKVITVNLDVN